MGFRKHFKALTDQYGDVIAINLIDSLGQEGALEKAYRRNVELLQTPKVKYIHFDFHDACKGNKFENVSLLYHQIEEDHTQMKFVHTQKTKPNQTSSSTNFIINE